MWIKAFRLRTLPLSISGILLGSAIAKKSGFWNVKVFIFALITTILFQILSNLANDLGDSMKGTDDENRLGPLRAVQSGLISIKEMKIAVGIFSLLSFLSAITLIYFSSEIITLKTVYIYLILTLFCIVAAIMYTVGKKAYGYHGLGDLMVFIFFGLVAVLGSFTLFSNTFDWYNILPAYTIGALSCAVLNLNNMRDMENDAIHNKRTIVVSIGIASSKIYHQLLIYSSFISLLVFIIISEHYFAFLGLIPYIILLVHLKKVKTTIRLQELDPELKKVALSTFFITLLTSIGLNI